LEFSSVRGVFAGDGNEYVDYQKKIREITDGLTLEKALEIGLNRREFYRLKKKLKNKSIIMRGKTLQKLGYLCYKSNILYLK